MSDLKEVHIFTDGSCLGNPGKGGYGAILKYKSHVLELSNGYKHSTNNRMEMMAVIAALSKLKERCKVVITSDSQYVQKGITEWISGWKARGWKTSTGDAVKNCELWSLMDNLVQKHEVSWCWVKGHNGHVENERCDELARMAASRPISALCDDDLLP